MGRIRKALVAGVGAFAAAFVAARSDLVVTMEEWIGIVGAFAVIGVTTWLVPNKPAEAPDAVKAVRGY